MEKQSELDGNDFMKLMKREQGSPMLIGWTEADEPPLGIERPTAKREHLEDCR
jgi:hypothetical protein